MMSTNKQQWLEQDFQVGEAHINRDSDVEPFHFGPAPAPARQDGGSGSGSSSSSSSSPLVNNLLLKQKFLQI